MTEKVYRVAVIDDEPLARTKIRILLEGETQFRLILEAGDGPQALRALSETPIDLVFLDVRMPGFDGFALLSSLPPGCMPGFIMTTAYDHFALSAFEADAIDYLLKPFDHARFQQALVKARRWLKKSPPGQHGLPMPEPVERLAVRLNNRIEFVETAKICWVEAAGNYVVLHLQGKTLVYRRTMAAMEELLVPCGFVRIHRNCLMRVALISAMELESNNQWIALLDDGKRHKVGRSYVKTVSKSLGM